MKCRSWAWVFLLAVAGTPAAAQGAAAERQRGSAGATEDFVPLDSLSMLPAPLRSEISVELAGVQLAEALNRIAREASLLLSYDDAVAAADEKVTIRLRGVSAGEAIRQALRGSPFEARVSRDGRLVRIVRARRRAESLAPQNGTVTGLVTDQATGAPLDGAQVRVIGTAISALTSETGRYRVEAVPPGTRRLQAIRIGYTPQTREIVVPDGGEVTLDFAMTVATTRLEEVVTTVTGDQRRLELGNAIATVDADSLMRTAPVMSFGDLLQGRSPGVFSLQESGTTGQSGRLRIRGLNSVLVSNDPIVVMDGVRIEAGPGAPSGLGGLSPTGAGVTGRLADLNPDEIASIEVVKGPSATTLYGTDAANGVIVITTKRGQTGRTRLTAFTEHGILEQRLDYADTFRDAYYAFGRSTTTGAPQRCTLLQRAAGSCVVDSLASFNTFTDPATRPFKDGYRQQYGLQLSGGTTGGTTYFLSGEYEGETGTAHMPEVDQAFIRQTQGRTVPDWQVRPNVYERLNLRANVTAPLGRKGSVTVASGFVSNDTRQDGDILAQFPARQVGYRDANDGWFAGGITDDRPAYRFSGRGDDAVRRFLGSVAGSYAVRDWLALRATLGADLSSRVSGVLMRRGEDSPISPFFIGLRNSTDVTITRYSLDVGATATRPVSAAVSSKTSIGVQYNRRAQKGLTTSANDLPTGGETVAGGTVSGAIGVDLTTAVAGGYLEQVFGFRDRLFLTGALRLDGGSAFGEDFSVAAYPKASASWVVAGEQGGPRLPGVTALRLRAAYGASGVQPGPTDALARVNVVTGLDVAGEAAAPGGAIAAGNPDLKPERTSEVEAGLDLELWASRVRLEFTAYQRTSSDALISRPNPPDQGIGARIENLGSVRNRGLELSLSADLLRGRVLGAGFTATGALNQNRLRQVDAGVVLRNPAAEGSQHEVGYPVFGLWGFTLESFGDANANGIIEGGEIVLSDVARFIGPSFPTREATLSPYVRLFGERIHLSGLLQYRGNFYRFNDPIAEPCRSIAGSSCRAVNDPSTPLAEQARAVAVAALGRRGPFIEDASYLLLREVSFGLTLPTSVARLLGSEAGQMVLAGRNLTTLWKASTVPVESSALGSRDNTASIDVNPGPPTYWLLRVHLNY